MNSRISLLLALFFAFWTQAKAEEILSKPEDPYSYYGDIWRPAVSKFLPGFDQYITSNYSEAVTYSGIGLGAKIWYLRADSRIDHFKKGTRYRLSPDDDRDYFSIQNNLFRERTLAAKTVDVAGDFSAYQAFRAAVSARKKYGEYDFIDPSKMDEPSDVLLAPFQFSYLKRPTTWIPLVTMVVFWSAVREADIGTKANDETRIVTRDPYTLSDAAYAGLLSYEAGTGEEATTRGYLQPMLMEYTGSGLAANVLQATYFTAVHRNVLPFVFFASLYEGWLIQHNNWRIGEGTFIHTWTDVISLSATYTVRTKRLTVVLPTLRMLF